MFYSIESVFSLLILNYISHWWVVSIDKLQFGLNAFECFECQEMNSKKPLCMLCLMGFRRVEMK